MDLVFTILGGAFLFLYARWLETKGQKLLIAVLSVVRLATQVDGVQD